jgi:hypothetical protein
MADSGGGRFERQPTGAGRALDRRVQARSSMETLLHRCRVALVLAVAVAGAPGCASRASRSSETLTIPPPPIVTAGIEDCRAGKLERCVDVAHVFDNPEADQSTRAKLAREFRPGCDRQVAEDCFRTAVFVDSPDAMLTLLERSCTGRVGLGCRMLADTLAQHETSSELLNEAVGFYTKGCELGDSPSCVTLGRLYEQGGPGVTRDVFQAEGLFKRGCEDLHDRTACRAGADLGCREGHLEACGTIVAVPVAESLAR